MQAIFYRNKCNFGAEKPPVKPPVYHANSPVDEKRVKYIMDNFPLFAQMNVICPAVECMGYVVSDVNIWEAFKRMQKPIYYYQASLDRGETIESVLTTLNQYSAL